MSILILFFGILQFVVWDGITVVILCSQDPFLNFVYQVFGRNFIYGEGNYRSNRFIRHCNIFSFLGIPTWDGTHIKLILFFDEEISFFYGYWLGNTFDYIYINFNNIYILYIISLTYCFMVDLIILINILQNAACILIMKK